jgi:hypothetical protein
MTTKEKLNYFKEKIEKATELNADFKNLVGIELFDYIHSNELTKKEFERRFYYLKNLANDKEFNILQDNLFEAIQKVIKLITIKEVREIQKRYNNQLLNRLKSRYKDKEENMLLTFPEIYTALQNKDNYYRLEYTSPLEWEISKMHRIVTVREQYEMVDEFFDRVLLINPSSNKRKALQIKKLLNKYNDCWYKFDELIYTIPIKLHIKNFEDFFFDCARFYPKEGFESYYNFFKHSTLMGTEKVFNEVKENAIVVIDDLVEVFEGKNRISQGKKYPKSIHLISTSLEPQDAVWLVFEERFEIPIRFAVKNSKGEPSAIKKLYDIAYFVDVPYKKVFYNKSTADGINNGLFRKRQVAKYMKTNKLEKPTLVQKSEKGTLVLKNEIPIKTALVKNDVPIQYQSLYIDKTK